MKDYCIISLKSPIPLVTAAIHNGHLLSENLLQISALKEAERLREEDPYTGIWGKISENHIIGQRSRFEFDLNRPSEKAIYLSPDDAWGLTVWKKAPSGKALEKTRGHYTEIYQRIYDGITSLIRKFGKVVILDLHSYNHRRGGPDAPPDDPSLNPDINIGTGTMDRDYWAPLVDRFIGDLRKFNFPGRQLDIRENIKFKGGYFPRWVHDNFKESACCISVEMKKIFMDEWTGKPDWDFIGTITDALKTTIDGLLEEISEKKNKP